MTTSQPPATFDALPSPSSGVHLRTRPRVQDRIAAAKRRLKNVARSIGIELRRARRAAAPLPLCADPFEAIHRRRAHDLVALACPLEYCIEYNGLSLSREGWHPLVAVAGDYLRGDLPNGEYEGSILHTYYSRWRPSDGRAALIAPFAGPTPLDEQPPYIYHLPWDDYTIEERAAYMRRIIELENAALGEPGLTSSDGYTLHGPVSAGKGLLELRRTLDLLHSISYLGYDRHRGDVTVQVLTDGNHVRYLIVHGHHRAAAMAAQAYEYIPAIPQSLVHERFVDHWPGVYQGFWSRKDALAYLHHLFEFDSRAWASRMRLC